MNTQYDVNSENSSFHLEPQVGYYYQRCCLFPHVHICHKSKNNRLASKTSGTLCPVYFTQGARYEVLRPDSNLFTALKTFYCVTPSHLDLPFGYGKPRCKMCEKYGGMIMPQSSHIDRVVVFLEYVRGTSFPDTEHVET